jgi:DNA topoisomerase-1
MPTAATTARHALVIVESPAKAKTIQKYLGDGYQVLASYGHIRDLPGSAKEMPVEYREEAWADLGVNTSNEFEPIYVVHPDKERHVKDLQKAAAKADTLYLATDGDREGEAIAWHLLEELKPTIPVHRLVFHEITRSAIEAGLKKARAIDMALVDAQETRRIVDRLMGYGVTDVVRKKISYALSAGRVQSVAVRLLVDRERERMAFRSGRWWDLRARFRTDDAAVPLFEATLVSVGGKRVAAGGDFDSATGRLTNADVHLLDEAGAINLRDRLATGRFVVSDRTDEPSKKSPQAPFTTTTLQKEASNKLSWEPQRTMKVAQQLYEHGHITYMRTDSTNLAADAIEAVRAKIAERFGNQYVPPQPRLYRTKTANAQEAHEAIRPAGTEMPTPESLRGVLDQDGLMLYELIWQRTIASQMADAKILKTKLTLTSGGGSGHEAVFVARGRVTEFPGYLLAYVDDSEGAEPVGASGSDNAIADGKLPGLPVNATPPCHEIQALAHDTQPPRRYTEASLIEALERRGIGRPSTYASIMEKIQEREFCLKRDKALIPTWPAFAVTQLLERGLPHLVDYEFTARLEQQLDAISNGEAERLKVLQSFYNGEDGRGLSQLVDELMQGTDRIQATTVRLPTGIDVNLGKHGPYVRIDGKAYGLPEVDVLAPADLDETFLNRLKAGDDPIGTCPDTGLPVYKKNGKRGPYVARGTRDDAGYKTGSLLPGMIFDELTCETALRLIALPRVLGTHPESGEEVLLKNGPHGPYVACGKETRSVKDVPALDTTLEQALALLAEPKPMKKQRMEKKVLRALGESPVTGKLVELLDGNFGPYVTDGKTKVNLSKGGDITAITLEQAVALIAEKAGKKKGRKKRK